MNTIVRIIITAFICVNTSVLFAQDSELVSRSAGKLVNDDSLLLSEKIKSAPALVKLAPDQALTGSRGEANNGALQSGLANRHDQLFSIYDADVQTLSDLDYDGYHHALRVNFDVDVDYEGATVYARLFLSHDGAPWSLYNTTDLFNIFEDDVSDEYEVLTELIEGYPPGYYDVLIEIYSLNHADMVTSLLLDRHYLGKDVLLEDLSWDENTEGVDYEYSLSYGGAGSLSINVILFFFGFILFYQVAIAARPANTLTPIKR